MRCSSPRATPKKIEEMERICEHLPEDRGAGSRRRQAYDEPVEDQPTFGGNALPQGPGRPGATGLPSLADDSGLCVDALNRMPGVLSRGGQGQPKDDDRNNRLLLDQLADVPDGGVPPASSAPSPSSTHLRGADQRCDAGPGDPGDPQDRWLRLRRALRADDRRGVTTAGLTRGGQGRDLAPRLGAAPDGADRRAGAAVSAGFRFRRALAVVVLHASSGGRWSARCRAGHPRRRPTPSWVWVLTQLLAWHSGVKIRLLVRDSLFKGPARVDPARLPAPSNSTAPTPARRSAPCSRTRRRTVVPARDRGRGHAEQGVLEVRLLPDLPADRPADHLAFLGGPSRTVGWGRPSSSPVTSSPTWIGSAVLRRQAGLQARGSSPSRACARGGRPGRLTRPGPGHRRVTGGHGGQEQVRHVRGVGIRHDRPVHRVDRRLSGASAKPLRHRSPRGRTSRPVT